MDEITLNEYKLHEWLANLTNRKIKDSSEVEFLGDGIILKIDDGKVSEEDRVLLETQINELIKVINKADFAQHQILEHACTH